MLGPLPQLLILVGNALTPGKGFREGPFASEAELRELVDLAEENQLIEDREREMIHSVFELGDTIVREVMVPRTDMVFIERHKTLRQALSLALRSGFSRIPVVGEGADDVVGVAYLKDSSARTYEHREGESAERVESVMRPAIFVPESKPVDELLREMQAQQTHMAIVVDEYGGTAGLVTIEDVLEEIVGEITDEYDVEHAARRASSRTAPCGSAPGCTSTSWPSCSTSSSTTTTSTPSAACWPSTSAGCRSPGAQVWRRRPRAHGRERARPAQPHRHGARAPGRRRRRPSPAEPTEDAGGGAPMPAHVRDGCRTAAPRTRSW